MVKVTDKLILPSILVAMIIILLGVYCLIAFIYYLTQISTVVKTKSGKLTGITIKRLGKSINCYLGIPYAEPPVGQLRFKKPVPKKPWRGLLKAVKQPNRCINNDIYESDSGKYYKNFTEIYMNYVPDLNVYRNSSMSEDCLYLSIFVDSGSRLKSNRTVMVWIHGGGFISKSAKFILFDGSTLAAFGDVIVVTINYRLGIFGFLSANQPELEGNYGLHDQVMALKWVKSNIYAFGGNPNNIVIFGESAGGTSVGFHLISQSSRNLFNRAILESGNAINLLSIKGGDSIRNAAIEVIKGLSCPLPVKKNINSTQEISSSSISCLRNVLAEDLFNLQNELEERLVYFVPAEDEDFFGGHPFDLVTEHKFVRKTEIIIGSNSMEGTVLQKSFMFYRIRILGAVFASGGPLGQYWSMDKISPNFTRDTILKNIESISPEAHQTFLLSILNSSFEDIADKNDYVSHWYRYVKIVGDIGFVCPDYVFINHYSSFGAKVYYYEFRTRSSIADWSPKWANGATHADELLYVFGVPLVTGNLFTKQEIELSKEIMSAWTQFAINGVAKFGKNSWIEYKEEDPFYMSIDLNSTLKKGFPGFKCEQYFEQFYEQLGI